MQQQAQRLGISDEEMLQRYFAGRAQHFRAITRRVRQRRKHAPALIYAACTAIGALAWFHTKTRLLA